MPITWRNVTGASAGNPASALAGASAAFSSAGRGALDLNDSLRKGAEIKRSHRTDEAIAGILASGRPLDGQHLAGLDGVNTRDVVDTVQGFEVNASNLESAEQNRELTAEEIIAQRRANDPAEIARLREHENAVLDLERQTLGARLGEQQLRVRQFENQENIQRAQQTIQQRYNSEGADGLRGAAMVSVGKQWEDRATKFLKTQQELGASHIEAQQALERFEAENLEPMIQAEMAKLAPEWLSRQQAEFGLTDSDLADTTIGGSVQRIRAANEKAIADATQRELDARIKRAGKAEADRNRRDLSSIRGGQYDSGDTKDNRLTEAQLNKFLREDMDIQIDPDDEPHARAVLRSVGGNKEEFARIMNSALTDRDRGIFSSLGDDDDIDWEKARTKAELTRGVLQGILNAAAEKPTR